MPEVARTSSEVPPLDEPADHTNEPGNTDAGCGTSTSICPGISDVKLQKYAKLPPRTSDGSDQPKQASYYLHVEYHQQGSVTTCTTTVRAQACDKTADIDGPCSACKAVKRLLLKKHLRHKLSEKKELTQFSPLSRVTKARLTNALKLARLEKMKTMKQLEEIQSKLEKESMEVSPNSHAQLKNIIDKCQMEEDSFVQKFWEEQQKAFRCKKGGMRWHPMMIRFAVLLHSQSPSAYRSLREIGVLKLPAESTLRDYTNFLHPKSGFQMEVFIDLKQMAENLAEKERWVCLLLDELCVKSGLVYDHRAGELVGFIDDAQKNEKSAAEDHLATHALVFMVVGITNNIKTSVGYFPTRTATADHIFPHLWNAIGLLETVCNLKVSICSC